MHTKQPDKRLPNVVITLGFLTLSLVIIGVSLSVPNPESKARQAKSKAKQLTLEQIAENQEKAMMLARSGCIPLVNPQTRKLMPMIPTHYSVLQDGSDIAIYDGQIVCSQKGDVAKVLQGKTTGVVNVGADNLPEFQRIYSLYLSPQYIY